MSMFNYAISVVSFVTVVGLIVAVVERNKWPDDEGRF